MERVEVYSSDFIRIFKDDEGYFIESFKAGMSFDELNRVISENPGIKITDFNVLRSAVINAPITPQKFGEQKERVSVEFSNDKLKAYVVLCVDDYELEEGKQKLSEEILKKLEENKVVFGIKQDALQRPFVNGQRILIAEGLPAQNGEDSVITMYRHREIKPRLTSAGKVNHYDVELIDRISAGDWLGERKDATPGIPGMTVTGMAIQPVHGKTSPLLYNSESVCEVYENGITTLRALKDGGVLFKANKICVSDHLKIEGNVDLKTGNIDFNGFVTIEGTIEGMFSVCADRDIEIKSEYGVGGVKEIESRNGNVYIRGGLAGKNKTLVKANNDVYLKYISDATIVCNGAVHIGYYCLNANITAKTVILESVESYIIGGAIDAEVKVSASILGSESEKRTNVSVRGFNRQQLKQHLETIIYEIEAQRAELLKIKFQMDSYSMNELTQEDYSEFEKNRKQYEAIKRDILQKETERKNIADYLIVLGEGEVAVRDRAYPNTCVTIKGIKKEIKKPLTATKLYYIDGTIKQKEIDWRG